MSDRTDHPNAPVDAADHATAVERADCCIVGGGPAGAVLALLLARQGVAVTLLEAHGDFDRDFRGDGLQPAVLDLLGQLGLADRLLALALARFPAFRSARRRRRRRSRTSDRLRTPYPFMTVVPQVRLLGLVVEEARRCPAFRLVMGARVEALVRDGDGHVRGVRYRARDGWHEVRAHLVVGADGRFSRLRGLAGLEPVRTASPVDLLWFRLPRQETDPAAGVYLGDGGWVALQNRGAEWQVGYSLAKGGYARLRAQGLDALRRSVALRVPWLAGRTEALRDWSQTSLLAVEACRLRRWYRPGLLLLGDAAHTMSPVGGGGDHRGHPGRGRGLERARASPARGAHERGRPGGGAAPAGVAGAHRPGLPARGAGVDAGDSARRGRPPGPARLPRTGPHPVSARPRRADLRPRRVARPAPSGAHARARPRSRRCRRRSPRAAEPIHHWNLHCWDAPRPPFPAEVARLVEAVDLPTVAALLGHDRLDTVRIYSQPDQAALEAGHTVSRPGADEQRTRRMLPTAPPTA